MLTYDFSKRGKKSMYEYLYECVRQDILEGRIRQGEKLPSKRELAAHHQISVKTVENAYEQLLVEGFLHSREKSGYFAAGVMPIAKPPDPVQRRSSWQEDDECFADFTASNTVYEKFPFSMWAKVMRQTLTEQDVALLKTVPFNGVAKLREAIADYLFHFRGMQVSPDQIIIGAGTEYLYGRLIRLLGKERNYALEDPGYHKIARIYEEHQVKWSYVSHGENGLDMDELVASGADVVHVSPGHHFPLGSIMPIAKRQELLTWAQEKADRYIIEDDYDCEFRYGGRPVPAIQSMDANHRVIYMNTFSKTLAPSIRISYMVLPGKLMERYAASMNFYSCTVSGFEQYALASFIRNGYFERHLGRMRHYYRDHRNQLMKLLKEEELLPIVEIRDNAAGTHFLMKVDVSMNDIQLKWAAGQAGIRIRCLSEFCHKDKEKYAHVLVINYSDMEENILREALKRLGNIIREDVWSDIWYL